MSIEIPELDRQNVVIVPVTVPGNLVYRGREFPVQTGPSETCTCIVCNESPSNNDHVCNLRQSRSIRSIFIN